VKIRILVAVNRDGQIAATEMYDGESGMRDAVEYLQTEIYDTGETLQYRIVEAEIADWQELGPVVKGEAKEVTP